MANGNGLNGTVAIPKWLLWLFGLVVSTLVGTAMVDRQRIGMEIDTLRDEVTAIRETRFREADGLRLRQEMRDYIDRRIREHHGGEGP